MLRLRPSSILMTNEDIHKALEVPYSEHSDLESPHTSPLPWDHCITIRRQRNKGKQKAPLNPEEEAHGILFGPQPPDLSQEEACSAYTEIDDDEYVGDAELELDDEEEMDEGSATAGSVADDASSIIRAFNTLAFEEKPSGNTDAVGPGILSPSADYETAPVRPTLSRVDGPFSIDYFDSSDWSVYEDPGNLSGQEDGNNDDHDPNYLADVEQDTDAEGLDLPPLQPAHLPLRQIVARHLDGAAELEVLTDDDIDEDSEFHDPALSSQHQHPPLPIPSSLRLLSRIQDTLRGTPRLDEYELPSEATLRRRQPSWYSPTQNNAAGGATQEDSPTTYWRRIRVSSGWMNQAFTDDYFSDDSFSGMQLLPDTLAELELRKRRRQMEAAKRTIR